jgi:hypothetical protein
MQSALQKSAGTIGLHATQSLYQKNAIDPEIRCLLQVASTTEHQHGSRAPQVNWGLAGTKAGNARSTAYKSLYDFMHSCVVFRVPLRMVLGHPCSAMLIKCIVN